MPLTFVRRSFAARLLVAFLGTVGLLLLVTLTVVRSETNRQIEAVATAAASRSEATFRETEEIRRAPLARMVSSSTFRMAAALEEALRSGDFETLVDDVAYELERNRFSVEDLFLSLGDPSGAPVATLVGLREVGGSDPAGIAPLFEDLLRQDVSEVRGYRVVEDRLFDVQARLLFLGPSAVGAVAFGFPIVDAEARAISDVAGVEVCFVVRERCLAGTERGRGELARVLVAAAGAEPLDVEVGGERWRVVSELLDPERPGDGHRVIAVPLGAALAPFQRISRTLLVTGLIVLLLAVLSSVVLSRSLTRPMRDLVRATEKVAEGDYQVEVAVDRQDELGVLSRSFNEMTRGLRLKERYRGVLDKVVSREVAEELTRGELVLGGETRVATILFADIRDFTRLTEGMEPQRVVGLINDCMEILSAAVEAEGGVVDKYVGDELMAVWGAPLRHPDDAARALRAAARMRSGIAEYNRERLRRGIPAIGLGVGVNTGRVVAGNTGSANRMNYTVLGDVVNLASRLCTAAEAGEILVSKPTRDAAGGDVRLRPAGERVLKGFSQPAPVFEIEDAFPGGDPATGGRGRREGGAAPVGGLSVLALALAGALLGPAAERLAAQEPSLPTLRDLGLGWASADGRFQVDLSGTLDLELYVPSEDPAWLLPARDPFIAPRLRVFVDAFAGDHVYGLLELRADRGPGPSDGGLEGRFEQAFVRLGPGPAGAHLQLGRFASPFGTYPSRHHTVADAFIRPPPPYDFRTMIAPAIVPPDGASFLDWKNDPDFFRPIGAPPVWGSPYPWGALLLVPVGPLDVRGAWVNSAPSSEPEAWGWNGGRFADASFIVGVAASPAPELALDLSWNRGPYLPGELGGMGQIPTGREPADYVQEIWSLAATWSRGPAVLRAELLHDRWEVPNVADDPTEIGWYVEAQTDLAAGLWVAGRLGGLEFLSIEDGTGREQEWDYDLLRGQVAAGYRVLRNLGVRGELMLGHQEGPFAPRDDLLSFQARWGF